MKKKFISYTILYLITIYYSYSQDTTKASQYHVKYNTHATARDVKKQFILEQRIENIAENNEDEDIDYTTLFDQLSLYYEHPINLNKKDISHDLKQLRLLDDFQINAIISHIKNHGKLTTIYELQRINQFEISDIRKILPFVEVSTNFDATHLSFSDMIKQGKNDLFIRFSRTLQETNGEQDLDDSTWLNSPNSKQLGSPNNFYMRYRFKYQNHLSIGITAEKDVGETMVPNKRVNNLFGENTTQLGFDYYSAHFFLREVGKIKALALGDFHVQLGQGLTFWSGLATGKSSDVMATKRNALGLKPYSSLDENLFMRGAGVAMDWKKFSFLAFGSKKMIDANIQIDSSNTDGDIVVSSFQASGIHNTIGTIEDKDAIEESIGGAEISYENDILKIGLISTLTNYNGIVNRNLSIHNQFQFNSNTNWVNGIHYSLIHRNFNIFGESSKTYGEGSAHLHGLLMSLHPKLALSVLYRDFDRNFQSVYSNAFAENSRAVNEKGLFTGLKLKLNKYWEVSTYFDQFQFPWLKYQVEAPNTIGHDGFFQITYHPTKKLDIYGRVRHRNKPYNEINQDNREIRDLSNIDQWNYRINFNMHLTEAIHLRNRIEYMTYQRGGNLKENGVILIQDIIYKPKEAKLSFNARFALFDTDSYNSRIYSYESDVLYYFRIPSYYNKGARSYLTLRYQFKKGIDLWLRYSNWTYYNRETIGSGLNEINGPSKSEFRAQLRFQF